MLCVLLDSFELDCVERPSHGHIEAFGSASSFPLNTTSNWIGELFSCKQENMSNEHLLAVKRLQI